MIYGLFAPEYVSIPGLLFLKNSPEYEFIRQQVRLAGKEVKKEWKI